MNMEPEELKVGESASIINIDWDSIVDVKGSERNVQEFTINYHPSTNNSVSKKSQNPTSN